MAKFIVLLASMLVGSLGIFAQGESLFDDSYLHEIHFNSMDTSLIDGSKIYQMVNMVFDGTSIDSIGIKEKGNISNNVPNLKVPFKVKTNKYVTGKKYDGIKEFTLHNNYQDPSMMREKLTYDLCGDLGLFALRTSFAKVYINGLYWGLYTVIEGKDEMFKQVFDHRDADAIESLDFGDMCFISNNPSDYNFDITGSPDYKLENGDETTAFARFATMIDKANNTPDANYLNEVSTHLNLEHFFKYQAANVYLMNFDSYIGFRGNQIYMYDTLAQIWQIIPWDFNASLNLWDDGNGNQHADMYPLFPNKISNGCIANKLSSIPVLKEYYLNAMCELVNTHAEPSAILNRIDFYKNQIQTAVEADTRKVYSNQQFDETTGYGEFTIDFNNFEGLKTFFEERHLLITQSLLTEGYDCSNATAIDKALGNEHGLIFYPNPTSGLINLDTQKPIKEICFTNTHGQALQRVKNPIFPLDIREIGSGLVFVSIYDGEQIYTSKIFIEAN